MGGKLESFCGLTGIGDLVVTCASKHSRNHRAGEYIGQGLSMEETSRLWTKNKFSEERIAFSILIGYLDSICEIADECENQYESHLAIDLTYETVKHLPLVLGH